MKLLCPNCGERFSFNTESYEEGDSIDCPNCGAVLTIVNRNGKLSAIESLEKEWEENKEEFEEFEEEN